MEVHAFSQDGSLFAAIQPRAGKDRLRVWSLSPGVSLSETGQTAPTSTELLSDFVLPDVQIRCMSWIAPSDLSDIQPNTSGREAEAGSSTSLLGLGTQDGRVLLFSPKRAVVAQMLTDDALMSEERSVERISASQGRLYAGYADHTIRVFNIQEGATSVSSPALLIPLPSADPCQVAANPSGALVGQRQISFYALNASSPVPQHSNVSPTVTFPDHHDACIHLVWIGPRRFVSAARRSNEVQIWTMPEQMAVGTQVSEPERVLYLAAPIQTLGYAGDDGAGNALVVVVDSQGATSLFLVPAMHSEPKGGSKKISASVVLRPTQPHEETLMDVNATVSTSGKVDITVSHLRGASDVLFTTTVVRSSAKEAFAASPQLPNLVQVPTAPSAEPTDLVVGQTLPKSQRDSPVDADMETAEPSLESRLKGLGTKTVPLAPEAATPDGKAVLPGITMKKLSATDLAQALTDALNSRNQSTLTDLLAHTSFSASVTKGSVKRLVGPVAVLLLEEALQRLPAFSADMMRTHRLIQWVRIVLITHTRYMMTLPPLVDRLAKLNAMLESRLARHDKFLELQGRLDLVLAQLEVREQLAGLADTAAAAGLGGGEMDDVVHGQEAGDTQDIALGADDTGPESAEEEDAGSGPEEAVEDNALESSSAQSDSLEQQPGEPLEGSDDNDDDDSDDDDDDFEGEAGSLEDFIVDADESEDGSEEESSDDETEQAQQPNRQSSRSRPSEALLDVEAEEDSDEESE